MRRILWFLLAGLIPAACGTDFNYSDYTTDSGIRQQRMRIAVAVTNHEQGIRLYWGAPEPPKWLKYDSLFYRVNIYRDGMQLGSLFYTNSNSCFLSIVSNYRVYGGGSGTNIIWKDLQLQAGREYRIRIAQIYRDLEKGTVTNTNTLPSELTAMPLYVTNAPPVPQNFSAGKDAATDRIDFSWDPVSAADFFVLKQFNSADTNLNFPELTWYLTNSNRQLGSFRLSNLQPRLRKFYSLQSVRIGAADGVLDSAPSPRVEGTTSAPQPQPAPAKPTVSKGLYPGRVEISWSKVDNAEYYQVFRAGSADGAPEMIAKSVTGTVFSDTTAEARTTYYYRIGYVTLVQHFQSSNSEAESGYALPPAGPSGVQAVPQTLSVKVSWQTVSNAAAYTVYRSTAADSGFSRTVSGIAGSSWTDATVQPGIQYYYKVSWLTAAGSESSLSSASAPAVPLPEAGPSGLTATAGSLQDKVALFWQAAGGAESYALYRAVNQSGPFVRVASGLSATNYEDTDIVNNRDYWYRVSSYNSSRESQLSEAVRGFGSATPLQTPSGLTASDGTSSSYCQISWNSVAGAARYRIYRAAADGSGFAMIQDNVTATDWQDTGGIGDTRYQYAVSAVAGDGYETPLSSADQGFKAPLVDTPAGLSVSWGEYSDKIKISWNQVTNAAGYFVNRSETRSGGYVRITGPVESAVDPENPAIIRCAFFDTNVSPGQHYYYQIVSYNFLSNESAPTASRRGYSRGVDGLEDKPVITGRQGGSGIITWLTVEWTAVADADAYNIYYSEYRSGPYEIWAENVSGTSKTKLATLDRFFFRVVSKNNSQEGSASIPVEAWSTDSYTTWEAPKNLTATTDKTNRIELQWDIVDGQSGDTDKYYIYRADSEGGYYAKIGEVSGESSVTYVDSSVVPNTRYFYKVSAFWTDGVRSRETDMSAAAMGYNYGKTVPGVVTGLSASDETYTNKVALSWNAAENAAYYRVYRAVSSDGNYSDISGGNITATSFEDSGVVRGSSYFYKVEAFNGDNTGGGPSQPDQGSPQPYQPPAAPGGVSATDGTQSGQVTVTWNSVPEAAGYRVFRSQQPESGFVGISVRLTGTVFVDSAVQPGQTYYYKVAAYSVLDQISALSAGDAGAPELPALPAAPQNLQAGDGVLSNGVPISWDGVTGAAAYRVFRADSVDGPWAGISPPVTVTAYTDQIASGNYYYRVAAYNASDMAGPFSSTDSGSPAAMQPPAAPLNVTATDGTLEKMVVVAWDAVAGAEKYRVYRSEFSDLPGEPVSGDLSGTVFTNIVISGNYYYNVVAVNAALQTSPFSDSAAGSPKPVAVPDAPAVTASSNNLWQVDLSWNSDTNVAYYTVFRALSLTGTPVPVSGKVTGNSFSDQTIEPGTGVQFYYFVIPFNRIDVSGPPGTAAGATLAAPSAAVPAGLTVSQGSSTNGITLSWQGASGDSYYRIYRKEELSDGYTEVAVVTNETGWTDTQVEKRHYYYAVRAYNAVGKPSAFSEDKTGWVGLSNLDFVRLVDQTVRRSHQKLTYISQEKLGHQEASGDVSGQATYDGAFGTTVEILIGYISYRDYYIYISGTHRTLVGWSKNGDMSGDITVDSPAYKGTIHYEVTVSGGKESGGIWTVTQEGQPSEQIPVQSFE